MKSLNEQNKNQLRSILINATTQESQANDEYAYLVKYDYVPTKLQVAKQYIGKKRMAMRWDAMTHNQKIAELNN